MNWTPGGIRSLRLRLGLTQEAFARRLGVSITTVSRWENGQVKPRGLGLLKLNSVVNTKQDVENLRESAIACAVADAYARQTWTGQGVYSPDLSLALEALEWATRGSSLRESQARKS